MAGYRIRVLNKLAPEGLALLAERFQVSADEPDPHGILVRSGRVDTADYPSLLAVARAGAGVNNITVAKASEQGICIFNTPGAN
ncbi:MAG: 3-phosphoglycerate dehydrogenase, partial [Deltaproteobacteria bacterium HGW-Deltaproteobacteria-16]